MRYNHTGQVIPPVPELRDVWAAEYETEFDSDSEDYDYLPEGTLMVQLGGCGCCSKTTPLARLTTDEIAQHIANLDAQASMLRSYLNQEGH